MPALLVRLRAPFCAEPPPGPSACDKRLSSLESEVAQIKEQQKEAARSQAIAQEAAARDLSQVRLDMQQLSSTLGQQLQSSIDSLKASQAQQEAQMLHGMAELKALLTQDSRKTRRTEEKE